MVRFFVALDVNGLAPGFAPTLGALNAALVNSAVNTQNAMFFSLSSLVPSVCSLAFLSAVRLLHCMHYHLVLPPHGAVWDLSCSFTVFCVLWRFAGRPAVLLQLQVASCRWWWQRRWRFLL